VRTLAQIYYKEDNMDKYTKEHEQFVIEKYAKIEHQNMIMTGVAVILLPVLMLLLVVSGNNGIIILSWILKALILILIISILLFYVFIRKCPNCGRILGKYTIFPTHCPYCKIPFK
jgi:uncharacterized membrane protein